jgi:hypothetical protein
MTTPIKPTQSVVIATQKADKVAEYQALLDGLAGPDLQGVDPVILDGTSWPRATLVQKFQSRLDATKATAAGHANLALLVASEAEVAAVVDPIRLSFKTFLKTRVGKTSPKMQTFGFAPDKPRVQSAASKAASAAKGSATKKAKKAAEAAASTAAATATQGAANAPAPATTATKA